MNRGSTSPPRLHRVPGHLLKQFDTLDELGRSNEAAELWRAYLKLDDVPERMEHARDRLATA